ncbi:hypothetical protein PoMZ_03391 [Pyricularia oryzae]|uniref:Uncharacterized protein n=1 Tax=Pyricularia oryzae TaxID=318829 RepID=A0A4P7N7M4_PYROR|nr:hypothetical protein PoMZ_03391 [Pyricularia oryzae]
MEGLLHRDGRGSEWSRELHKQTQYGQLPPTSSKIHSWIAHSQGC